MCRLTDDKMCKCRRAVMNAYNTLVKDDPESVAMDAAYRVYRYHHPEDAPSLAKLTVERWVHADRPLH